MVLKYEHVSWPDDRGVFTVTAIAIISAPASDDEGSTAATDGSTLRTSPAEHGGSVGSESGGSAIDSVAGEHSGMGFQKSPVILKTSNISQFFHAFLKCIVFFC